MTTSSSPSPTSPASSNPAIRDASAAPGPDAVPPAGGPRPGAHIRSFHARRGRITALQSGALERLWPAYGLRIDGRPLDLPELFGGRPVVVEIGFGMGDATAAMAEADPATGILAVDVHMPGQGALLHRVGERGLENVRVAAGDAVVLLRDMLPAGSLAGVRIYFPDPWPKARHHKRRLVQPGFVRLAASRLAPGGTVHCATDWEPYAEQMREVLAGEPLLANRYGDAAPDGGDEWGWAPRPDWRPMTKFERQGLAKGHRVRDLIVERR